MTSKEKILILVIAYEAENHIASLLDRLDKTFINGIVDVLVLDDGSTDKTTDIAEHFTFTSSKNKLVGKNSINQGYGGNQKIGYKFAIKNQYLAVVLLHGDGQYPPEMIPELLDPILQREADAVLGSRMGIKKNALLGGMPLYKWVGNIIITKIQNFILSTKLSEFHTGFRAYKVSTLDCIPFEKNSNQFDFDTDILIQLAQNNRLIEEINIPTYYGDEICRVPLFSYAINCLKSCFIAQLQELGIFYNKKFDYNESDPEYSDKTNIVSSHSWAVEQINPHSRVLDIGCGKGFFVARKLLEKNCVVYGIDSFNESECNPPDSSNLHYRSCVLDRKSFSPEEKAVDSVLMLDVIEHTTSPEMFLASIALDFENSSKFLITTPNIAFFLIRLALLFGKFNYGKKGILDMTHFRLFTFASLKNTLTACGYTIEKTHGIPAPFQVIVKNRKMASLLTVLNVYLIKVSRGLFSYQIAVVASKKPSLEELLSHAKIKQA